MNEFEKIAEEAYQNELEKIALTEISKLRAIGSRTANGVKRYLGKHKDVLDGDIRSRAKAHIEKKLNEKLHSGKKLELPDISRINKDTKVLKNGTREEMKPLIRGFINR